MPLNKQEPLMNQKLLLKYSACKEAVKLQKVIERIEKCSSCIYYYEEESQEFPKKITGVCYSKHPCFSQFPPEKSFQSPVHPDTPACCMYSGNVVRGNIPYVYFYNAGYKQESYSNPYLYT